MGARIAAVTVPLCLVLAASAASPIVMRHDVKEERFLAQASRYPATASVRPADAARGLAGEGTLIDPQWILTAAHVASLLAPNDLAEVAGTTVRIDRVVLHPEWHRVDDVKADVALLRLRSPIRHVRPVKLYELQDEAGLVVTFVGRGGTGTGLTGPTGEDRRRRAATNRVEKAEGPFLQFRFDAPGDSSVTELEGISGPGDSGGPAYAERNGELFVIGVSSWQDASPTGRRQGRYGVLEYYCRVSFFHRWIRQTLTPGRHEPH